jgi:hypothetical protein
VAGAAPTPVCTECAVVASLCPVGAVSAARFEAAFACDRPARLMDGERVAPLLAVCNGQGLWE